MEDSTKPKKESTHLIIQQSTNNVLRALSGLEDLVSTIRDGEQPKAEEREPATSLSMRDTWVSMPEILSDTTARINKVRENLKELLF